VDTCTFKPRLNISFAVQDFVMQDEIVFLPDHRGVSVKHVVLIFGGFFIFVQVFFLGSEPLQIRLAVTVAFAVFLLLGLWLSELNSRNWPRKIFINRSGIGYGNMRAMHGIDLIPWSEIARMDLFYTGPRLSPHLRIGLKPGVFRNRLKKTALQRLSMGLDVNIPVSVNVAPDVVLQTAERFWQESKYSSG
jgi:hypothetical protein